MIQNTQSSKLEIAIFGRITLTTMVEMDWVKQFSLFLFDFDGLLVNSEDLHFAAYVEMCQRRGYALGWDFYRFCLAAHYSSTGLRDAIYLEFPELQAKEPDWTILYAEKKAIYQELIEKGELELLPGVAALLTELKQQRIARCVATNSTRLQVEAFKKRLPLLESIELWITREDYAKGKPEPDAYLTALNRFERDLLPIGFEDSLRGVEALKNAGVQPILICPDIHPQMDDPRLQGVPHFSSFEAIPEKGPLSLV